MPNEVRNYGVILGRRETDWAAGRVGASIPYEVVNESGDWTQWLPPGEWQWFQVPISPGFIDLMNCVTMSANNVLETLYFFITGVRRNFSDRFTAMMSGTTTSGNYLWKVGDSVRHDGLVDEEEWPVPPKEALTWSEYYKMPPIEVINKAKLFNGEWTVNCEEIPSDKDSLIKHLKQAPVQVIIPGHAIMTFTNPTDVYKYFDSYNPWIKQNTEGFIYAYKYTLTKKTTMVTREILEKLYQLGFKRALDDGGLGYIGKPVAEVLDALLASKENEEYSKVYQSVKSLENDIRSGAF